MNRGRLIVFEGIDGCGKSTQLKRLAAKLRAEGFDVVETREPTNGEYGRRIRELARAGGDVTPAEELGWFVADRREHVARVIAPALAAGRIVLCDRYFLSTVAYQGARGSDPQQLLAESEAEFPLPDLVVLFEIPVATGLARVHHRGAAVETHFEETGYLERVDAIFRGLERAYIARIDGSADVGEIAASVAERVSSRLDLRAPGADGSD